MGMFDDIKCSAEIGALTNVNCQTKEIDRYAGGTMSFYWVDPNGLLWTADFSGTADFVFDNNSPSLLSRLKCIPNGNRGKVVPVYLTDYVTIYSSVTHPDGLVDWAECRLHFIEGKLQGFRYINNCI